MNKEEILDAFRFMRNVQKELGSNYTVMSREKKIKALKEWGISNDDECAVIIAALGKSRGMTQEDAEKELEKAIIKIRPISADPQPTTEQIPIEKRLTDLFEKLSNIREYLRITADVLTMTNTCLIDHYHPDADPAVEQATSTLMVIEDRLEKIQSDLASLPFSFKEE